VCRGIVAMEVAARLVVQGVREGKEEEKEEKRRRKE
jgi:hypothetical protein